MNICEEMEKIMEAAKCCPFCGKKPLAQRSGDGSIEFPYCFKIFCGNYQLQFSPFLFTGKLAYAFDENCIAIIRTFSYHTLEEALAEWNKRR